MTVDENQSIERTLESAVVVSWTDLICGPQPGLIHIEYGFAATGNLDYLKLWSSVTRGHWRLVCEYWMSPSTFHPASVHFENGYQSEGLAHILEFVMQHQNLFVLPMDHGRQGLLQIPTPTEAQTTAAAAWMNEAFNRLGSPVGKPVLA